MNNIPQVAQSLGGGESEPALFVMIMSTTNAIGRMFAAAGSDMCLGRVDRTAWLTAAVLLTAVGMGLGVFADYDLLFPTAALVGFSYGCLWGVVPVLILELFGPEHFGTLYTSLAVCPALSSLALATWLAGGVYDRHAVPPAEGDGPPQCTGRVCFRLTFIVCAITACVGVALCVGLQLMARPTYRRLRGELAEQRRAEEGSEAEREALLGNGDDADSSTA